MSRGSGVSSTQRTDNAASERGRDRAKTQAALEAELARLVLAGVKPTVTAVAAAVGVTPPLVHNTYPQIASAIRDISGRGRRQAEELAALKALKVTNRELRDENSSLRGDLAKVASINQVLIGELALARSQATATVVSLLASRSTPPQES
jgi:hypothetical protein